MTCKVAQSSMTPASMELEQIDTDVLKSGNLDLALPVVERNYKTYFHVAQQLNGLQQQIIIQNKPNKQGAPHDKAN